MVLLIFVDRSARNSKPIEVLGTPQAQSILGL